MMCCATCGIAEFDEIKLKKCTVCDLARYCGVKCQKEHRPQHKKECKKRAAELRDEILFKQPESSYLGDCPICFLPLSLDAKMVIITSCCSKFVCDGCDLANQLREIDESLEQKCAFCRHPLPSLEVDVEQMRMKRVEANDPVAMCEVGLVRYKEGDCEGAFEYYTKAAELGDARAHFDHAFMYSGDGEGVVKDVKKMISHLEKAAIKGHTKARHNLGCIEEENGRMDRAIKHWIIAANLGYDGSLEVLKIAYRAGCVGKEDLAAALRGHQAAVDATKSPQRKAAAKYEILHNRGH
mmetsp:Transcript_5572/g.8330  ORF Transcript_5572/g.8330 Transcript_5572/m.8330 type:complete len:296 (+) Transcript_5572:165-1052(+)